ncbi:hypothetical protein LEP48_05055 [Isoptericola sp. NEAU-Y5]|uniref:Integral membrane protein n=1 Tax=Isoptericola luteus TaxID=2879484 RepID=A0ABS7ZCE6_9MICO|nr:hypothetical protein [Isoptericola sp. NEAU-Y5]MCA5892721.1 hypothetical protein [Isoptericola sp. NEAU-Y5]
MNAGARRTLFTTVLVLFFVVSVARLVVMTRRDGLESATVWIAVLVVALIIVVTLAVIVRRARSVAAHVARRRPGVPVIPVFTTGETRDEAQAAGAPVRGIAATGGSPAALALVPGEVELWVRREDAPRWSVRRVHGGAQEARAVYGSRGTAALRVSDGATSVTVVPAYRPLRATGGAVGDDVARAVREVAGA